MQPKRLENLCLYNSDMNLWDSCEVVNLKTNFRVRDKWNETLNRIRYGEQTEEDYKILRTRYTENFPRDNWNDAIHTFYSNKEVNAHNIRVLNEIPGRIFSSEAELPKGRKIVPNDSGTVDDTNFQHILHLKKGANVMHISNTSIVEGLVNGVTGKVLDFVHRTVNGRPEVYAVIVKFDDPEIGKEKRKEHLNLHPDIRNKNGVPIFRIKNQYKSKKRGSSRKGGKDLWLRQFPLTLVFGSTGKCI